MKKPALFALIFVLLFSLLCGCADKQKQPENTEPTTTETEPATQAPTEAPTEPATEAPTQPEGLQLNMDLLSNIGRTFDQLTEKYGEVTGFGRRHGGYDYQFKNGLGKTFCFYGIDVEGTEEDFPDNFYQKIYIDDPSTIFSDGLYHDERGNFIPIPKKDAQCLGIEDINARHIFINAPDTITIYDIQKMKDIAYFDTGEEELYGGYCTSFVYDNINISIRHGDSEIIDLTIYKDSDKAWYYKNGSATMRKSLRP